MPASKIKDFEEFSELGSKFILRWNQMDRYGAHKLIGKEFNLGTSLVYRLIKKFNLHYVNDPNHPGRKLLLKRIRKLYWKHGTTSKVARILRLSAQSVNKLLVLQNIKLNPPYVVNVLLTSPKNGMSASQFNDTIKKLYVEEGMSGLQISKFLKCDHNSVCKRLKLMNVYTSQSHRFAKGGYPCLWCGKIMETVWITRGNRKQKYHSSKCKNRCKDYRKLMDAERRIKVFEKEIRKNWGNNFEEAKINILKRENKGCI